MAKYPNKIGTGIKIGANVYYVSSSNLEKFLEKLEQQGLKVLSISNNPSFESHHYVVVDFER